MKIQDALPVVALSLLTASCVIETPPPGYGGGYPNPNWGGNPNRPNYNGGYDRPNYNPKPNFGANNSSTYRAAGLKQGQSDRARGQSYDPSRYFGTVPPQFRNAFSGGYSSGYGQMAQALNEKYYQGGSVSGAGDFQRGLSYDPSRYAATVPNQYRDDFSRGYANGWRSAGGR